MTRVAIARPSSVSSRWRSPSTDEQAVALHARHGLRHRGAGLAEALGDARAQRGDALLLELEDRAEVHLRGVDEVAHGRLRPIRARGRAVRAHPVAPRPASQRRVLQPAGDPAESCSRSDATPGCLPLVSSDHQRPAPAGGAGRAPSLGACPTVLWFRRDLRRHDNPALLAALDAARADGDDEVVRAVRARPRALGRRRRRAPRLARALAAGPRRIARRSAGRAARRPARRSCPRSPPRLGAAHRCTWPPTSGRTAPRATPRVAAALEADGRALVAHRVAVRRRTRARAQGRRHAVPRLHAVLPRVAASTAGARRRPTPSAGRRWRIDERGPLAADGIPDEPDARPPSCPPSGEAAALDAVGRASASDGPRVVRRPPRPPRPRRHLEPVGAPALGRDPPAHAARRPRRLPRPRGVPQGDRVARVLRRRPAPRARQSARTWLDPRFGADAVRRRARTPTSASPPGARAAPASRSSTPACASCSPRAGCTTGCAWSWRRSS